MTTPEQQPAAPRSSKLCAPWALLGDIPEKWRPMLSDDQWPARLLMASEILYELAGERWLGTREGDPCSATAVVRSRPDSMPSVHWPYLDSWGTCGCWWWNSARWAWSASSFSGFHPWPVSVELPHREVIGITSVTDTAGNVIDPSAYVLRGRWVDRLDGKGWSVCGTGPTTFSYSYGLAPPEGGVESCVLLAAELAKAWIGQQCALPARVTSITRQGVSMNLSAMDLFDKGKTGIGAVDLWLASINPYGRRRPARLWSPDLPEARIHG